MTDGLHSVCELLSLFEIKERIHLRGNDGIAHDKLVEALVDLYSNILEYQIQIICHLSKSAPQRGYRSLFEIDDWPGLLSEVKAAEQRLIDIINTAE